MQGSSGVPFFSPSAYEYLCGKDLLDVVITLQDVPACDVRKLLAKVTCNYYEVRTNVDIFFVLDW